MNNLTTEKFINEIFDYQNETEWHYKGERPAIIDFSADNWCQPCKKLTPILNELSEEYKEHLNIYKIDVDDEPELASIFNIRSVPSILFVPMSGEPQISMGLTPKYKIKESIKNVFNIEI